ncbi:MAG: DUF4326 domain-containing protein [Candidatus Hodarchaeales archaeon]
MPLIRVQARKKGNRNYINCMRGTWLGNPFPLARYSLDKSLSLYETYLLSRISYDSKFRDYLLWLGKQSLTEEIRLGCTCKLDQKCHVDILIKFIGNMVHSIIPDGD